MSGDGAAPFGEAGFAAVDFLAVTDECDDDGPVEVAIHDTEDELGFGEVALELVLGLGGVPCTLGLVEDDDFVGWDLGGLVMVGVEEAMDVLDKGRDFAAGFSEGDLETGGLIAGEGFGEDADEGAVPGEEGTEMSVVEFLVMDDIEAGEGLAGTGDAGDEADKFFSLGASGSDGGEDSVGGAGEVLLAGVGVRDVADVVAGVERLCGFDDGGSRRIWAVIPDVRVERLIYFR